MKENEYQKGLKKRIKQRFPDSIIFKTDPSQLQGCPDLLILNNDKWASLEVKASMKATHRPNQDYRVQQMNEMSFASYIYPENEEEVLNAMERLFAP